MGNKQNKSASAVGYTWAPYWMRGSIAFVVGGVLYEGSMRLLGVHLEFFTGLSGFNFSWILGMSLVPVAVGVVIGLIYGFGGKYLAHFPPALVMLWHFQHVDFAELPAGAHLLPWGMWIMFVILQMEFCAIGGFIGEILIRKRHAWDNGTVHLADSEALPEDDFDSNSGKSV
ncbi:MAG: hypothetical protein COS82_08920 [Zetaproteobacteria bacterium CG06_land_8_20_14_3_00_59_53]|nr:MAG: hypothetical protein AUK36_04345 [Zetaproteobacteria bacterium CG2_30_59_37]PIO89801.1 MAG: hypothetical protein COX56_05255 [Zetaproteobacteria bacterium CG23_combo_of_CG06-09_8_20_14_all_59_86]PIQ64165.1 MAG: hypothetical protein COV97_09505 [Zetaproteobacteria bacterium CG11_big_fil_rev_8_21_14_0_20_59_439]PIU69957.1 MAG: hypothetical protein COS82_08920 [Zetaproteobacteria bacterium CG06_land_8_20_14_3_00_59_53]PIU96016.1 MAG: hypothetical protein COS62_11180 [Zetaproteobacteria bac